MSNKLNNKHEINEKAKKYKRVGLRPNNNLPMWIRYFLMILVFIPFTLLAISAYMKNEIMMVFLFTFCNILWLYLAYLGPYFQDKNNYGIFVDGDELVVFYKNRKVFADMIIDESGKFAYADDENKINCFSYEDGRYMSITVKSKISNYIYYWLDINDLLSPYVTTGTE